MSAHTNGKAQNTYVALSIEKAWKRKPSSSMHQIPYKDHSPLKDGRSQEKCLVPRMQEKPGQSYTRKEVPKTTAAVSIDTEPACRGC